MLGSFVANANQYIDTNPWLALVAVATGRAVRVTPTAAAMLANKQTEFFKEYREKGVPYRKQEPMMALPAIYFVDGKDAVLKLLQGEVSETQIAAALAK